MAIKLKFFRRGEDGKLTLPLSRDQWQKRLQAAQVSLRSVSKRLPWSRALTRKGVLYFSALLLVVVTFSGILYLVSGSRLLGGFGRGEGLQELAGLTGATEQEAELPAGGEALPPAASGGESSPGGTAGGETLVTGEESPEESPGELAAGAAVPVWQEQGDPPLPGTLIMPVLAPLESEFGWRQHPVLGDWRFHTGIDLAASLETPVQAVLDGVVADVYQDPLLGQVIVLAHGPAWESRYGHCQGIRPAVGSYVAQGEVIALVGETGLSQEPHLHFELRCNGQAVDPLEYLPAPAPDAATESNEGPADR